MAISPNLPGPSSARFSFFPDENQEAPSNQELTLKDRIKAVVDRFAYKIYSEFNPPHIMPLELAESQYKVDKEKFFAKKPESYEEARERVLSYTEANRGTWGPDLERKNVDLYADPKFRETETQAYADRLFEGEWTTREDIDKEWCIFSFCAEELHALYKREPKYLRKHIPGELRILKGYNKPILARHKREWDQLSSSKKAEKIFGKRWKYEAAAGVSSAAACFFLCHGILRYQQLQSPQQPSTF